MVTFNQWLDNSYYFLKNLASNKAIDIKSLKDNSKFLNDKFLNMFIKQLVQ